MEKERKIEVKGRKREGERNNKAESRKEERK